MEHPVEAVRPAGPVARRACADVREQMSRFAVGLTPGGAVAELARHARACADCAEWIDALALARSWLERRARGGARAGATPIEPSAQESTREPEWTPAALDELARSALHRELLSRLARDLLALHHGEAPRAWDCVRRDLRRLVALGGPEALRGRDEREAARLLARAARAPRPDVTWRGRAGHLAARFDRWGLDVALAHMALLEREGRRAEADHEAARVLGLFG